MVFGTAVPSRRRGLPMVIIMGAVISIILLVIAVIIEDKITGDNYNYAR